MYYMIRYNTQPMGNIENGTKIYGVTQIICFHLAGATFCSNYYIAHIVVDVYALRTQPKGILVLQHKT